MFQLRFLRKSLVWVTVFVLCACHKRISSQTQFTPSEQKLILRTLQKEAGLVLPTNVIVMQAANGNLRCAECAQWTLFLKFTDRIEITSFAFTARSDFTTNTSNYVAILSPIVGYQIERAETVFRWDWNTNKFQFQMFVLRAPTGDYFHIDQFPSLQ